MIYTLMPSRAHVESESVSHSAAAAASLQSCPTLRPIDGSPPGSPVPGILQARTLEWVAISFSNAWKWKGKGKSLSRVWLLAIPWTAAHQAPLSMRFSRQEYWSGVPLPSLLVTQWYPTHGDPMDRSPPHSVQEILQVRILERVAIPFSWGFFLWGIEPRSPALQANSVPSESPGSPEHMLTSKNRRYLRVNS